MQPMYLDMEEDSSLLSGVPERGGEVSCVNGGSLGTPPLLPQPPIGNPGAIVKTLVVTP